MSMDRVLRKITELIVTACNPDKVVLFGSWAKGTGNIESDIDLLIVGPFEGSLHLRARELRELLHRHPLRFDVHVVTPREVEHAAVATPYGYVTTAIATGVVLFDKPLFKSTSLLTG